MAKYKVLSRIKHGGKRHEEGAIVELPDADAKILLDLGRVEPAEKPEPKKTGGDKEGGKGSK